MPCHRVRGSPGAFAMEIQPLLPAPGEHSPSILPKQQPQRIGAANSDRKVVGSFQRRFHGGMELRRHESPGCCSGCPECSCCGSPSGNWTLRCSSYRPGSPGSSLMTTYRQRSYHTRPPTPTGDAPCRGEGHKGCGALLQFALRDLAFIPSRFEQG